MTRTYAIAAASALIVLLGATAWFAFGRNQDDRFAACGSSSIAGGTASIGGPFTLVDGQGRTVTDKDVITKPSLIYFGYTFCPDVCPLDNARNAEAVDLLVQRGYDVQPVFISVDPARDTPDVVGEYAKWMHERMIGLTGTPEQVKAASQAYKTYYLAHPAEDEFYTVDHSTFTYLMLPGTGFAEFFKREDSAEDMATRTACFIDAG